MPRHFPATGHNSTFFLITHLLNSCQYHTFRTVKNLVFRGGRPSLLTPLKFGFKIGFWGQYGRDGANRSGFFVGIKKPRPN